MWTWRLTSELWRDRRPAPELSGSFKPHPCGAAANLLLLMRLHLHRLSPQSPDVLHDLAGIINLVLCPLPWCWLQEGVRGCELISSVLQNWFHMWGHMNQDPSGGSGKTGWAHNCKKFRGPSRFCPNPYIPLPTVYNGSLGLLGKADLGKVPCLLVGLPSDNKAFSSQ